jgi:hypothetical protein
LSGSAANPRQLAAWQAIGALFVLIAVVRVGMVLAFAPSFPFIDEWEGVVIGMAKPLLHGQFDPFYLLTSHNKHPLLWTKLVSLFFLWADDLQFDNVPVCIFNQIVYALGSATLAWSAAARLGPERGWFLFAAMLVIVLPFDWENITMGWGNPYAILSFFSVGLIVACGCAETSGGHARHRNPRWHTALSMGGGRGAADRCNAAVAHATGRAFGHARGLHVGRAGRLRVDRLRRRTYDAGDRPGCSRASFISLSWRCCSLAGCRPGCICAAISAASAAGSIVVLCVASGPSCRSLR